MASSQRIGAEFLDAVHNYADTINAAAVEATQIALEHVQTRLQEQARQHENWVEIAEHISIFSQDGRVVVGIPNGETLSEAEDAEYGTDAQSPTPLFRTSQGIQREAVLKAREHMVATLGPVPL